MSCSCGTNCTGKCNIIDGLKGCIDSVLSVRDCIGAALHPVEIMTRTWSGERPGDGTAKEKTEVIKPSPYIVDYSHNLRLTEGGSIRQGDIILKNISKNTYPKETSLDCSVDSPKVEKYYLINERLYTVIHVKENYLTWDVHLRKRSDETRRGA